MDSDAPRAAGRIKDVKGPKKSEKHRKPEEFVRKQEEENAPTKQTQAKILRLLSVTSGHILGWYYNVNLIMSKFLSN